MKKQGISTIEVVVVAGIIAVLGSFGAMKIKDRAEKNAMLIVKSKVTEFMRVTTQRAFEEGEEYRVVINILDEVLRRKDSDGNILEEEFLPEILSYVLGNGTDTEYDIKIDDRGHGTLVGFGALNRNLFVFNSEGKALYKVNIRDNTPLGYIIIKSYIPAKEMDKSNYLTGNWEEE